MEGLRPTMREIKNASMKFSFFRSILAVILNKNSEEAFHKVVGLELYHRLLIASLSKPFSNRGEKTWKEITTLLPKVESQFVAQLVLYFREHLKWRRTTLCLLVKWSALHRGDNLISQATKRSLQGPADIIDLLTYYQNETDAKGKKKLHRLSKQIQKGIAAAFGTLTEKQLLDLRSKGTVSLKDALILTHPKAPNDVQKALFHQIYTQKWPALNPWKADLRNFERQKYATVEAKELARKQKWENWIMEEQLSYYDLLRNLRNILKAKVSEEALEKILTRITDPIAITNSRRLPFFFLSEFRKIEKRGRLQSADSVLDALETAMMQSAANLQGFSADSSVLLAVNSSPKMYRSIGKKNQLRYWDIGVLLEKVLKKQVPEVISRIFGESPQDNPYAEPPSESAAKIVETLTAQKKVVDKVLIFSNQQEWSQDAAPKLLAEAWKKYKKQVAPQARLYSFDLMNYEEVPIQPLPSEVFLMAGWSERMFEVLAALDTSEAALPEIQSIKLK